MVMLERTPKIIWIFAIIAIVLAVGGLSFLTLYSQVGAVLHPKIFILNSVFTIIFSIGIVLRYACAVYLYALLKISMIIPLIVASEWYIGVPFSFVKLIASGVFPLMMLASCFYYIKGFNPWPFSNK